MKQGFRAILEQAMADSTPEVLAVMAEIAMENARTDSPDMFGYWSDAHRALKASSRDSGNWG